MQIIFMSKGMAGETVRTVFLLLIAVVAFVLLWLFFSGQLKFSALILDDIVKGVRNWFCSTVGGAGGTFCRAIT